MISRNPFVARPTLDLDDGRIVTRNKVRVDVELPKLAGEILMLLDVKGLLAEKDHEMAEQFLSNARNCRRVERLRQIDAKYFGAD